MKWDNICFSRPILIRSDPYIHMDFIYLSIIRVKNQVRINQYFISLFLFFQSHHSLIFLLLFSYQNPLKNKLGRYYKGGRGSDPRQPDSLRFDSALI